MTSWWARWRLKSPTSRLFIELFIQAQMKEIMIGEFPTQRASDAENVSIWWRHHEVKENRRGKQMVDRYPTSH